MSSDSGGSAGCSIAESVAAVTLGAVEAGIGQPEKRLAIAHPLVRIRCDSDADRNPHLLALFAEVVGGNPPEDALGKVAGLGVGRLRQQHHELLAPIPGHDVDRAL